MLALRIPPGLLVLGFAALMWGAARLAPPLAVPTPGAAALAGGLHW